MHNPLLNPLKTVIICLGMVLFALSAFILFHFNQNYQLNTSLEAFLKRDFPQAKQNLELVKNNLSLEQYYLSLFYITKEQGKEKLAQQYLDKAFEQSSDSKILTEIILNQALVAFNKGDIPSFSQSITHLQEGLPRDMLALLQGLHYFSQQEYAKALKSWEVVGEIKLSSLPWIKWRLEKNFPNAFVPLKKAEAKIHLGLWVEARRDLEVFLKIKHYHPRDYSEAHYLIGNSYLMEAVSKPLELSGPYFELAKNYFENLPIHSNDYLSSKKQVLDSLQSHALKYLTVGSLQPLSPLFSFLQHWKAKEVFENVTSKLMVDLDPLPQAEAMEELKNLCLRFPLLLTSFKRRLVSDIATYTLESRLPSLQKSWQLATALALVDNEMEDRIAPLLEDSLITAFQQYKMDEVLGFINFFKQSIHSPQNRLQLAKSLVKHTEEKWEDIEWAKQSLKVLIAVDEMLPLGLKRFIKEDIKLLLQRVYTLALKEESKEKIHLVHHAAKYFNFKLSELSVGANT